MFDWSNFLDLAEALADEPDESRRRSAVSRAYYAAFCSARDKLHDENKYTPTGGGADHVKVWNCFQNGPDKEHRRIAQAGRTLKRWRGKVDYDNEVPRLAKFVDCAPKKARDLLSDLQIADYQNLQVPCYRPVSSK